MILHAVSIAALFVDQLAYAPVMIQCAQSAPKPEWKWWFGALAPWVGPLLSCVVSIYVAWKVFRWQGGKDRRQWIRDQKMAEWKELITYIAEIQKDLPIVLTGVRKYEGLEPAVLRIVSRLRNCLFIWPKLLSSGFIAQWESFVEYVSMKFMSAVQQGNYATTEMLAGRLSIDVQQNFEQEQMKNEAEIRQRLEDLLKNLREIAHQDM